MKAIVGMLPLFTDGCHPNAPNLSISILIRELKPGIPFYCVCVITGVSLKDGSTRYSWILLGRTEYTSVIHNCSTSQAWLLFVLSRGMWYWTWLRSGLNPKFTLFWSFIRYRWEVGKNHVVNRLRELSSLLALVLHLAIGSYILFHPRREQSWPFQMEDKLACDFEFGTNVSLLHTVEMETLEMNRIVEISWSQ